MCHAFQERGNGKSLLEVISGIEKLDFLAAPKDSQGTPVLVKRQAALKTEKMFYKVLNMELNKWVHLKECIGCTGFLHKRAQFTLLCHKILPSTLYYDVFVEWKPG